MLFLLIFELILTIFLLIYFSIDENHYVYLRFLFFSKFDTLRNISLRDECISGAGLGPRSIGETLPNIVELDLSRNLLSSWEDVAKITQQLPHLRWLNLR